MPLNMTMDNNGSYRDTDSSQAAANQKNRILLNIGDPPAIQAYIHNDHDTQPELELGDTLLGEIKFRHDSHALASSIGIN
jgi:hypothetical protein